MSCHIQLSNLALAYRWRSFQKQIFHDLNLCIPQGSFVTITGGNGSGKSSLIKVILGLVTPDSGKVYIMDVPVRPGYPDAVRENKIAYLSQQIEDLFFSETVAEELNYQGRQSASLDFEPTLSMLGLDTLLDRKVECLSGGERQSLALAQFILRDAPLLILDEPSSYLDQTKSSILKTYLQEAHSAGKTIIHVTQFVSEIDWGTHIIDLNPEDVKLESL